MKEHGLVLTFWTLPITTQPTIEFVPPSATEGVDVFLLARNLPGHANSYVWYKGESGRPSELVASYIIATNVITKGPEYSSEMTIYPNGSLLIQKVTQAHRGPYTLEVTKNNSLTEEVTGHLSIHRIKATTQGKVLSVTHTKRLPKPHITSNNSNPVEHEDTVVLTCGPETPDTTFLWSINSQSLPDSNRLQLSKDNRTLTLLRVTRTDTGPYVCETRNPVSARRSDPLSLNVLYGPDTPIIFPPRSYYRPGAALSLSCHAASNPPAQYSWLINGWYQQSTQELFIPNIFVSDSGAYTCLAHNNATGLNSSTVKNITVSESATLPSIQASKTTVTEDKDAVILTCLTGDTGNSVLWLLNNQRLRLTDRMTLSQDRSSLTISPVKREDVGEYQCEVLRLDISSQSDPITLTVIRGDATGLSAGAISVIVIGVLVLVLQVSALGRLLLLKFGRRLPHPALHQLFPSTMSDNNPTQIAPAESIPWYKWLLSLFQELLH
ncbi:carcinoembryonic antigen-related cell adhesion molecule 6-like isoform X2 [Talpa occidentalis]|uniref:carcinoembryonic antigen-related cell adhesion molecule 6-like isoform X2 n=1 Tax=Talpa occidentalis TaxID=50954 RepID=UPI0023F76DCC|nr:carcinoembryonic antigen-related cell adhesion molecule 6-like isoform X2 [Talpa occidentalis]